MLSVRENFTLPMIGRLTKAFLVRPARRALVQEFADRLS